MIKVFQPLFISEAMLWLLNIQLVLYGQSVVLCFNCEQRIFSW